MLASSIFLNEIIIFVYSMMYSVSRVPYEATSATTVAMSDLLPIFQPAGQQKSYYTSGRLVLENSN